MESWERKLWDKYYLDDEKRKLRIISLKEEIRDLKTQIRFAEDDRLRLAKRSIRVGKRAGIFGPRDINPRGNTMSSSGTDEREAILEKKKQKLNFLKQINKKKKKKRKKQKK